VTGAVPWRIVIVDDSPDDRAEMRRVLRSAGRRYELVDAENGAEAIAAVLDPARGPPSCMLLDYFLPDMDAAEALGRILRPNGLLVCPVVVITGVDEQHGRAVLRLGAQDYIGKEGLSSRSLTRTIENAVERWTMANELHARDALIRERDEQIAMAFEAAGVRYFTWDIAEDRVEPGLSARDGRPATSVGGSSSPFAAIVARVDPRDRSSFDANVSAALGGHGAYENEFRLVDPDGSAKSVRDRGRVSFDAEGRPVRLTWASLDITERLHLEGQLRELADGERAARFAAEDAMRAKDEFLAMLGHELRNPLAPIVSALERMKTLRPPGRDEAIIGRQLAHMVKLVDDLLDLSRVSRRELSVVRESLEIARIVASAIEMTGPLLKQRAHALSVDVPEEGLAVDGDPMRLAQVVSNLLTNAAKYTDPGGRIGVRASRDGGDVVLSVVDNGTGIAADALGQIFEPFVQAPQALDRSLGGLGVGLTLSRYLVELHGGTLHAKSGGLGCGSEFVVRLPRDSGSIRPGPVEVREDPPATDGGGRRVLLVDDNADALMLLAESLRRHGYEVTTADDGPTALRLAASLPLDVAVLDIGLPGMDGYELAERLRKQSPSLALVALTGYGQPKDRSLAEKAGFGAHLLKPINLSLLTQAIARKS
jgi:signal transduction histidine kinase/DNA-binding response OmpR family regulator